MNVKVFSIIMRFYSNYKEQLFLKKVKKIRAYILKKNTHLHSQCLLSKDNITKWIIQENTQLSRPLPASFNYKKSALHTAFSYYCGYEYIKINSLLRQGFSCEYITEDYEAHLTTAIDLMKHEIYTRTNSTPLVVMRWIY